MYTSDLASALPDERPVTSVAVVESVTGCPPGFTVVSHFLVLVDEGGGLYWYVVLVCF